ncbi:hypothetical protein CHU92_13050 [Flavobacterium cyanobacteriorum]|uniref:Glycosyltransferase RgtA/B/C/D-like domain-containing protein n=1 Tax=Flavobacterium cyanobacteriorum TaxID=2022802 RepID=A0A255YVS1_9FLAO|nr:glycosyltransferase family 39 protein [Flavobacterium cyanobacteriorum]OYQ33313.1 hypothetical protein CHU92_13050 [Flavobacterium cyanobacteriorum]
MKLSINFYSRRINIDIILLSILLVAAILRIYHIGFQDIWVDELHTMVQSDPGLSWNDFDNIIRFREGIPHLYFILVRFFSYTFGYNIISARLVSVLGGLVGIYYMYKIGKELKGRRLGLIAALLLTLSLFHIQYSQEARSYALLATFVIITNLYLIKFIKETTLKNALLMGLFAGLITNMQPIGLVNVAAVYLTILIFIVISKQKALKLKLFRLSLIAGILTLILFTPTISIILKVSGLQSFWIPKPNLGYLYQVYLELLGKSSVIGIIFFIALIFFLAMASVLIVKKQEPKKQEFSLMLIALLVTSIWLLFYVSTMVIKSYLGVSIILHRYFITMVPAMMLIIALSIEIISNIKVRNTLVVLISLIFVYVIFEDQYYTKKTKSEFSAVAAHIHKQKTETTRVVSVWAFILQYYYNKENNMTTYESTLDDYMTAIRTGKQNPVSFWYVDGNSRPFTMTPENLKFAQENFVLRNRISAFDAWGIEFKSRHNESGFLDLHKFNPSMFDGSGSMIFVQNLKSVYPPTVFKPGEYIILFNGLSLPEKPLNGENAHFNIYINNKMAGDFNLSNQPGTAPSTVKFTHKGGRLNLQVEYDNDEVVGTQDRNAIINSITIKKIN